MQAMAHESAFRTSPGNPVTEKPFHYTYLKEFRVEQCKAFLQHKCNQHRPFTCFHWHFMNQRRRRPVKRRDGTFNYSPDVYCTLYDENTGMCPNGDDCPYLHRTAGDTERRYHLRYYKTSTCVYETDSRGYCVKNGPHCAFAHGPHDLRPPVYDIRELQGIEDEDRLLVSPLMGNLEKERGVLVDDPRWQDSSFVLAYYKTEPCKRPPRLCRQGYACPFFHNNKDRRRTPRSYKYRSTPCPNVKLNDEWGDPTHCDQGDVCGYCHTRTEQQFHPEIYKSTKCNDVQQTGYCPRGPFCAFAHDEKELTAPRELTSEPMLTNPSPVVQTTTSLLESEAFHPSPSPSSSSSLLTKSLPQPIGRLERTSSTSSASDFQKAPGAEVKSKSFEDDGHSYIRKQIQAIDGDASLDENERTRRKQNLLRLSFGSSGASPEAAYQSHSLPSSVSDALEAMGLDDLNLEELDSSTLPPDESSSTTAPDMLSGAILGQSPVAQGFLQSFQQQPHHHHMSGSYPYSTPLGALSPFASAGSMPSTFGMSSAMAVGGYPPPSSPHLPRTSPSPFHLSSSHPSPGHQSRFSQAISAAGGGARAYPPPPSPSRTSAHMMQAAAMGSPIEKTELVSALREELRQSKAAVLSWQESWRQAKQACDAWKKEAEDVVMRGRHERDMLLKRIEELDHKLQDSEVRLRFTQAGGGVGGAELRRLSLAQLEDTSAQIRADLERVDAAMRQRQASLCTCCNEQSRCVLTAPCNHCVVCESCADELFSRGEPTCPYCNEAITQRTTVILPV